MELFFKVLLAIVWVLRGVSGWVWVDWREGGVGRVGLEGEGESMLVRDRDWEGAGFGEAEGRGGRGVVEFGGGDKEEVREVVVEVWQLRGDVFRGVCMGAVKFVGEVVEGVIDRGDVFRGVCMGVVKFVGVVVEGVIDRSVFRDDCE